MTIPLPTPKPPTLRPTAEGLQDHAKESRRRIVLQLMESPVVAAGAIATVEDLLLVAEWIDLGIYTEEEDAS